MNEVFDRPILTVRVHAGFNAASFLAGLLAVSGTCRFMTADELLKSRFPDTKATLTFGPTSLNHIAGFSCRFDVPHEHVHRCPADIAAIYDASKLSEPARAVADSIWSVIANAEARVHGMSVEKVHFHEVGRMANILAIGLIGEVLTTINPSAIVAGPIPVGDGVIECAHGVVPNPAPAMLAMLDGVCVRSFAGQGEPVTPTGLGVLLGCGATFGGWPTMRVRNHATVFAPGRVFEGVPNGTIFALGTPVTDQA